MLTSKQNKKILVEIVGGAFPKKKKCEVVGNAVMIEHGRSGRGGAAQTAKFDNSCLVPYMAGLPPFRYVKYKLILREGASQCVSFAENAGTNAPSCSVCDVSNYGKATVIKLAGLMKPENRSLIYALLIISIIVGVAGIAVSAGVIRL